MSLSGKYIYTLPLQASPKGSKKGSATGKPEKPKSGNRSESRGSKGEEKEKPKGKDSVRRKNIHLPTVNQFIFVSSLFELIS